MDEWVKVAQNIGKESILVFDSYYTTKEGVRLLENANPPVRFIGAVNPARFDKLAKLGRSQVTTAFQSSTLFNDKSEMMFTTYKPDVNSTTIRYCISNLYTRRPKNNNDNRPQEIYGYDLFGKLFSGCDQFNKSMFEKSWPSSGGKGRSGVMGNIRNFALTCILLNTIVAFEAISNTPTPAPSFRERCEELADELYEEFIVECFK